jgi:hypothetical protein
MNELFLCGFTLALGSLLLLVLDLIARQTRQQLRTERNIMAKLSELPGLINGCTTQLQAAADRITAALANQTDPELSPTLTDSLNILTTQTAAIVALVPPAPEPTPTPAT